MLIAHLADIHLGARRYGEATIYEDIFEAFDEALDLIMKERPKVLVIAGDLFDSPRPTNDALMHAIAKFKQLTASGIKVIAAHGEHDTPGRREPSSLMIMESAIDGFYAPTVINPVSDADIIKSTTVSLENVIFHVYPFKRQSVEKRRELAQVLLNKYRAVIEQEKSEGHKTVFVAHFSVDPIFPYDYVTSLGDLPRADYVALGHVHARCISCAGKENIKAYAYPGSLYPLDIAEVEAEKSIESRSNRPYVRGPILVDLSSDEPTVHELKVEIRRHEVLDVEINDPKDVETRISQAISRLQGQYSKPPLVHLRVKASAGVSARLIEVKSSEVGAKMNAIVIPHVIRVADRKANRPPLTSSSGRESLDLEGILKEDLGLDTYTAKVLVELLEAAAEGSDEEIDKALEKLASWQKSLEALRAMIS